MARELRLDDLVAWQLARELEGCVFDLVRRTPAERDLKFASQLTDAALSVTSNVTEGFHRFRAREFAQFLRYARGSLGETEQRLRAGVRRNYFAQRDIDPLLRLSRRLGKALFNLQVYLTSRADATSTRPKRPK